MRLLLIIASLLGAAALACANPSCGTGGGCGKGGAPLIETISYALEEMGIEDNADIRTAIRLYLKEMRSLSPKIPLEAFSDGNFYPEMYARNATPAQALEAQISLFETIYLILNEKQKQEFPVLMGMYQYHMQYVNSCGTCGGGMGYCAPSRSKCNMYVPRNCGTQKCPLPSQKKPGAVER